MRLKKFLASTTVLVLLPAYPLAAGAGVGLVEAARNKDSATVRSLLNQEADVNATAPDGATALHWAVYGEDLKTAKLLIDAGADVKAANRYGVVPLVLAATNGDSAMIELLLDAGADANAASEEGETVLMIAARTGDLASVTALLDRGAEVDPKEGWRGQTALMWAAAEGHVDVVEALIASGADIHARSENGFTPLLFAVREGKPEVVEAILKAGGDVNETLPARRERRRGTAQGIAEKDRTGANALDLAVINGHFELASMLLDAGADPNFAGQGWAPLHTVTWVRRPGTGSNDPAPQGSGNMDSLTFVRKLVAKGADVNIRMTGRSPAGLHILDTVGATPFLAACRTADHELMRLLVELGAGPTIPTEDGTTPLMVAAGVGTRSPGEDAGAEPDVLEAVKLALELGNDINAVDKHGETAMHGAAYKHVASVAKFLAENGADPNIYNQNNDHGWTALRIAVGVHRGMNLRSSAATAEVIRNHMAAAGVSTDVAPEPVISGATR